MELSTRLDSRRRAVLGLWAVPGVGPRSIRSIGERVGFDEALASPPDRWLPAVALPPLATSGLQVVQSISELADRTLERVLRGRMRVAFKGDPDYPARLLDLRDAPEVLFYRGTVAGPRRRLAMVGTRRPDGGFAQRAVRLAEEVAGAGVGVVSGAAEGIDYVCHLGALRARGETWAFLGSALDEIDPAQREIAARIASEGGAVFSELPPGVRADRSTFPRRNRLISGASDAVLVLRAGIGSGAIITVEFAEKQGRPVLALPGELDNPAAAGCNQLIHDGRASLCTGAADVVSRLGLTGQVSIPLGSSTAPAQEAELSDVARRAYAALERTPLVFEDLLDKSGVSSGELTSALCELELAGLVLQRPGRRYERV